VIKLFFQYVHEQKWTAIGVLTQGFWHHPVAYLSKQLDAIFQSWLPCLHALAATAAVMQRQTSLS
jgi:hypothetical protein